MTNRFKPIDGKYERGIARGVYCHLRCRNGKTVDISVSSYDGFKAWLMDIPFDIVTVCFSSAVIGTGCDYAIHYMLRLRKNMLKHNELMMRPLIEKTLVETGRPIFLSTASIVAGMMMLTFASYTPIRYFGMLMSISLVGCMVSTLIFMPPVAIVLDKIGYGISSRRLRSSGR